MKRLSQKWSVPDGTYRIEIEPRAWTTILQLCSRAGQEETGGILIGYYTNDQTTAVVTEATPPPKDSLFGPTWFHRGIAGIRRLLSVLWEKSDRRYYLGEWHYHPSQNVEPSSTDIEQMVRISEDPSYHCHKPIMLILGQGKGGRRSANAFVFPRGMKMLKMAKVQPERDLVSC